MDNPRADKVAVVTEVKDRLVGASGVVVTEYRGLTVAQLDELRRSLRPVGGRYKVYKNTLVKLAVDDAGVAIDKEHLLGPTALAFTEDTPEGEPGDLVTVAKVIRDFSKANPDLIIKGGLFEGEAIDADGVRALADVEPREVLLAKFAGLLEAPMQQLASLLEALPRNLAYGLKALAESGGAPGAPADESAPEPEAAEEAASEPAAAEDSAAEDDAGSEEVPAEDSTAEETSAADEPAAAEEAAEEPEAASGAAVEGEANDSEQDASEEEE